MAATTTKSADVDRDVNVATVLDQKRVICKIQEYLDELTENQYKPQVAVISHSFLTDYSYPMLCYIHNKLQNLLKRALRHRLEQKAAPYSCSWLGRFKQLLQSMNPIDNGDNHPLGLHLSIFMQSDKAQKILNVKHLKTSSSTTTGAVAASSSSSNTTAELVPPSPGNNSTTATASVATAAPPPPVVPAMDDTATLLDWLQSIVPKIRLERMHYSLEVLILPGEAKNKISTIRLKLNKPVSMVQARGDEELANFLRGCHERKIIHSIAFIVSGIVELNFHKLVYDELVQLFDWCDQTKLVAEIIFYSNCRLIKTYFATATAISNTFKYLFCLFGNYPEPYVQTATQRTACMLFFVHTILFIFKDNLRTNHDNIMTTPLSTLSGNNPRHNILRFAEQKDALTASEREKLENISKSLLNRQIHGSDDEQAELLYILGQLSRNTHISLDVAKTTAATMTIDGTATTAVDNRHTKNERKRANDPINDDESIVDKTKQSSLLGRDVVLYKHKVNVLSNDRDFRLCGYGSQMAGLGLHDLVVTLKEE